MAPVNAWPSQLRSSSTRLGFCLFGPQSPLHVPFSGCPNCADAGSATARTAMTPAIRKSVRIEESSSRAECGNCIASGNELPYQVRIATLAEEQHEDLVAAGCCRWIGKPVADWFRDGRAARGTRPDGDVYRREEGGSGLQERHNQHAQGVQRRRLRREHGTHLSESGARLRG